MNKRSLNDRAARWQGYAIEQLTFAINLFIGLSGAGIAFATTLWLNTSSPSPSSFRCLTLIALFVLGFSVLSGCIAVIVRYYDFQKTAEIIRARKELPPQHTTIEKLREAAKRLGRCTKFLFHLEALTFFVGALLLALAFWIRFIG